MSKERHNIEVTTDLIRGGRVPAFKKDRVVSLSSGNLAAMGHKFKSSSGNLAAMGDKFETSSGNLEAMGHKFKSSNGNLAASGGRSSISSEKISFNKSNGGDMGPVSKIPCICERPKTKVFCRCCGFFQEDARVRALCALHPQIFYLLDMDTCPRCNNSGNLQEVCPYDPQMEWMNHPVFKQEIPLITEEETGADPSKNFFKRPALNSSGTALLTLPANVRRGGSHTRNANSGYCYGSQSSYLKRKQHQK